MSKLFTILALFIFTLVFCEGMLLLVLYNTEPTDDVARDLHYFMLGGIIASIIGYFVTPILTFILYRLLKNKEWFIKLQEKPRQSFIILLIMIIVAVAPIIGRAEYKKWKLEQKYEKRLTADEMITRWFDYPAGFSPPMKDLIIKKENGQVYLYMEYDEQADRSGKRNESQNVFQEDLLHFIRSNIFIMSPYKELQTLTVQVKYKNVWYEFDQIPLKNELNKPFKDIVDDKEVDRLVRDKMQIVQ